MQERVHGNTSRGWGTRLLILATLSVAGCREGAETLPAARRHALEPAFQDAAVACLALGSVDPPLEQWSEPQVAAFTTAGGLVLQSYLAADFEAFRAMRTADWAFVDRSRRSELPTLWSMVRTELGSDQPPPASWSEAIEAYWSLMYVQPVLLRAALERSEVRLRQAATPASETAWKESFRSHAAELVDAGGFGLPGRLVVPHRRPLRDLLGGPAEIHWFDWALPVESRSSPLTLLMRFVLDPADGDWFLERAATLYPPGCDPAEDRQLILF